MKTYLLLESHQYIDILRMFRPITKWNAAVSDPDIVSDIVRKAFKLAELEKPGATHIELSEDVAKLIARGQPLLRKKLRCPAPDHKALTQADLIIAVGYDIAKYASKQWNPRCDKKIVNIEFSYADVYKNYVPDVEVICDISSTPGAGLRRP